MGIGVMESTTAGTPDGQASTGHPDQQQAGAAPPVNRFFHMLTSLRSTNINGNRRDSALSISKPSMDMP